MRPALKVPSSAPVAASRIVGLPQVETNIRGFSNVSLLLIDEASRVPDNVYRALRPVLSASDGDLWLMSTPNGKRGFFWDAWARGGDDRQRVEAPANEDRADWAGVFGGRAAGAGGGVVQR